MKLSLLLLNQLIIMLCFLLIGYVLAKKKLITMDGCKELVNLLLLVVIPFVILNSFLVEKTNEKTIGLFCAMLLSLISFILSMGFSYMFYGAKHRIENFSAAFSNAGFIGIPLVQATLGSEMVFYIACYVAFLNIFQWIYGAYIMSGDKKNISIHNILTNAVLISFCLSFLLYMLELNNIPYLKNVAQSIAAINSPIAMIIIGVYLTEVSIKNIFCKRKAYICSAIRLVIIPLISLLIFKLIPVGTTSIKLALLIVLSAPVGSNVAMFAQKFKQSYTYAVEIVMLSTILSIVIMPLFILVAQTIL